ncbi:hypothetical protein GF351_01535 [Candidatus Woesearchaeota archaeon]|nr:hypothetical protein [Candidatus Woesearchaeota archaeon]
MKRMITKDKSATFFSRKYQEHYHSISGALEEAFKKYAEPCRIAELAEKQGSVNILDICFGIGYNSLAAIATALKAKPDCCIRIIALENDREIIEKMKTIDLGTELEPFYKLLKGEATRPRVSFELIIADAIDSIKLIDPGQFRADAVFLDPFSPKRCPELWTTEFLKDIRRVMKRSAILATYSCARAVRENLKSAGFRVKDGPFVGRYAPSTLAFQA